MSLVVRRSRYVLLISSCMVCSSQATTIEFSAFQISYLGSLSNGVLDDLVKYLNFPLLLRELFID